MRELTTNLSTHSFVHLNNRPPHQSTHPPVQSWSTHAPLDLLFDGPRVTELADLLDPFGGIASILPDAKLVAVTGTDDVRPVEQTLVYEK